MLNPDHAGPIVAYALAFCVQASIARNQLERGRLLAQGARRAGAPRPTTHDDVTVLQPVLGGDPALEDCLYASAHACAGRARFVWAVDEDDPVGLAAAERALARLRATPGDSPRAVVEIRSVPPVDVLAGDDARPTSPKSAKLAVCLEDVETPFVCVLDDDTTLGPEHLAQAVGSLSRTLERADLYTGLPSYTAEGGAVGSELTAAFVNSFAARTYAAPVRFGAPLTINGMFWATRTEHLRRLGGFNAVRHELCDDLAIAQLYRADGATVEQGSLAQVLVTRGMPFGAYVARMHRWMVFGRVLFARVGWRDRVRVFLAGLAVPLLLWWALIAAGVHALRPPASADAPTLLLLVLFARHVGLRDLVAAARDTTAPRRAFLAPLWSVAAELLLPLHALHALCVPTIRWRSRVYRVASDGRFRDASE